jgi:hypothetical protein
LEEIKDNVDEFKQDKLVEQEFEEINKTRLQTSKVLTKIRKNPQISSHYLKKQSDARVKYDTEFIKL